MFTIAASGDFMSDKEIDMQEAKEACFEFVGNYYSEQGKFPREFTFCGVVFPFCDYLGWFSDEEIEDVNYPSLKGEACRVTSFKSLVDQTECY